VKIESVFAQVNMESSDSTGDNVVAEIILGVLVGLVSAVVFIFAVFACVFYASIILWEAIKAARRWDLL
jgi:uncharacterized membrane protein